MEIKNPIVFDIISSHQCRVGGRGKLGVMSDFNPIEMKFGMQVEIDVLNSIPKFGHNQLNSALAPTRTKKLIHTFCL